MPQPSSFSSPSSIALFSLAAPQDARLLAEWETHLLPLQQAGRITYWSERHMLAGEPHHEQISRHLEQATIIVLLLSSDFFADDECYTLMEQALQRSHHRQARVIPLLLRPVAWDETVLGGLSCLPNNECPVTDWPDRDAAFLDCVEGLKKLLAQHALVAFSDSLPTIWYVPYPRNPFFTGRENVLAQIHASFQQGSTIALGQPQAISGLGGIGKTETAIEYAYQYHQAYQAVFWSQADSEESLTAGYVAIAQVLRLPERVEKDQTIIVQAVLHWLQTQNQWLLILDNADTLALVRPFLPLRSQGHILLTTRAQAGGGLAHMIEVDILTEDAGACLLLRRAKILSTNGLLEDAPTESVKIAREITRELGGLPLALDQAGAYIEETQCRLEAYQQRYERQRSQLLKRRGGVAPTHPEPVSTTWSLAFAKIGEANLLATELLWASAFLAPDSIPEELLVKTLEIPPPGTSTKNEVRSIEEGEIDEAIAVLRAYSLIQRNATEKTVRVHRLVQAVVRDQLEEQEQMDWITRVICAVENLFPLVEFHTWTLCARYLPQALACEEWIEQWHLTLLEGASLLHHAGRYLNDRAQYKEATPLLRRALAIREQQLGPTHPDTAASLTNLAFLYRNQGKYQEAEPLYQRALAIREQQLGPAHIHTATSLNNLAVLYRNQERYQEAEPLYQRVLAIYEQQLGPTDLYTATSLNNLAILYRNQGKYQEAESLLTRALDINEQQLGPTDPNIMITLNNLATLHRDQGKYQEAETLYRRALAICEQQLGPTDPYTASSLNNLAELHQYQGRDKEAGPLYQRALAIREQQLGPTHPNTARSLNNLARFYQRQGKVQEAEPLFKRALDIFEQQLGPMHSDTQTTRNNYVGLLETIRLENKGK